MLPYPGWQERAKADKKIPDYATLMAWNERYAIYNEWEDAFLLDMQTNQTYKMGDYYGDLELALIDKHGAFVVVIGSDQLGVFDLVNKECFWAEIVSGDLVLKEHEAARWLTKDELDSVEWLPADITLIENIKKVI